MFCAIRRNYSHQISDWHISHLGLRQKKYANKNPPPTTSTNQHRMCLALKLLQLGNLKVCYVYRWSRSCRYMAQWYTLNHKTFHLCRVNQWNTVFGVTDIKLNSFIRCSLNGRHMIFDIKKTFTIFTIQADSVAF